MIYLLNETGLIDRLLKNLLIAKGFIDCYMIDWLPAIIGTRGVEFSSMIYTHLVHSNLTNIKNNQITIQILKSIQLTNRILFK